MNEAQIKYLLWLDQNYPDLYRALYASINNVALGATTEEPSLWDKIVSGLTDLAPVYLATEQQKQLNDMNLQRAKNGLPPIDASNASTISTQVGLSPQTQRTMLWTGGLIAFALVAPKLLRG